MGGSLGVEGGVEGMESGHGGQGWPSKPIDPWNPSFSSQAPPSGNEHAKNFLPVLL